MIYVAFESNVTCKLKVTRCFVDWREAWSVPLKDQITAFAVGPLLAPSDVAYIVASRDRALRVRAAAAAAAAATHSPLRLFAMGESM